ncbi:hypothetical protein MPG82_02370 [Helicobacter pylori]|uniref:hypothetical protein n=1 Tax=Helicobacter pylori TaxID=210 RepID=UPI001FD4933D|nr:hypothetical protein [Helicobacter pylori]UOR72493.1 hypothetical protein MPG82_02370 [Helicobacter pylori]
MIDNEKDPINSHSVGYDDLTMDQKDEYHRFICMSRLYERMLKRLVVVISGCRAYNDEAIIKEFGSKEATN